MNQGVLWVAGEAYPLRSISRVGLRSLEVDKQGAWKKFIRRTLFSLAFCGILAAGAGTVGVLILPLLEALLVWRLIAILSKPPLYGLVLNSAGIQSDAVWSTDNSEIQHLVHEIIKAMGHPDVTQVTYNVQHAVQGDLIAQYGLASIGRVRHGGSGNTTT
ncbi:hypothetical protein E4K73_49165 [Streptomyces sp. IB201691-2A2]|nr:hypothetical protein E4K73_49165 [Streptomyces sp. IB201691-2A2]